MSILFDQRATLHLRGEPTGEEDRHGNPVLGPPRDVAVDAWWEISTSDEDLARAEQQSLRYWLFLPEGAPVRHMDEVTLHGVVDERCRPIGAPMLQPGGVIASGYVKVAVERRVG